MARLKEAYNKWAKNVMESQDRWRDGMVKAVSHADAWYKHYVPKNSYIINIETERERDRSRYIDEYIERIIELQRLVNRQTIDLRGMMRTVTETLDYDGEPKVIVVPHRLEPRTYKYSLQVRDRYVLRKITLRGTGTVVIAIKDYEGGVIEQFPLRGGDTYEFNRVLGPHILEVTNNLGAAANLTIVYYGPVPPGYDPVKQEEEEAYNPFEDDQVRIDGI